MTKSWDDVIVDLCRAGIDDGLRLPFHVLIVHASEAWEALRVDAKGGDRFGITTLAGDAPHGALVPPSSVVIVGACGNVRSHRVELDESAPIARA